MSLGSRINEIRKEKGVGIDELSRLSGVPKGTLSKITAGITTSPTLDTVKAIAKALECKIDDFDDLPIDTKKFPATGKAGFELINRIKKEKKLTNEDIANISGVPKATIDKITSGTTTNPNFDTVWAIAEALGCSVDEFKERKIEIKLVSPKIQRITEKLPKLTDSQLESIERRVDVYIDDNEMEDREVISHRAKKAT